MASISTVVLNKVDLLINDDSQYDTKYNIQRVQRLVAELEERHSPETTAIAKDALLEDRRQQLWCEVAAVVAAAPNATNPTAPGRWANNALDAFDEKFNVNNKNS